MEVILLLSDDAALRVRKFGVNESNSELSSVLKRWNVSMRAQHPDIDDEQLSRYYIVEAPLSEIEQLVAAFSELDDVTAAYVKPEEALP